jgi:rod shape determining protein RodA
MVSLTNKTLLGRFGEINWWVVLLAVGLCSFGIAMMVSAGGGNLRPWAMPQIVRFGIAFFMMITIALMPLRLLMNYSYLFYFACLSVLIVVDVAGHIGMGAQRWIKLGGFNLQPSEIMKIALILALARYFHGLHHDDVKRKMALIPPVIMILLPAVFILREPNLGTTSILVAVGGTLAFLAGVQLRWFTLIIGSGLAAAPVAWHFMHDYQKRRVLTFLDPATDPLGAGYNILQSIIAIGSGGIAGKGFLQGTQSQLNFLPEKHTDFVFTMVAEEFGFMGGAGVIGLYALLLMSGLAIAMRCRSMFASLIAAGVTATLFFHVLINIAMVMGLLPVVGVPLPMLSYGGSIMFSSLMGVGLILNAHINREDVLRGRGGFKG